MWKRKTTPTTGDHIWSYITQLRRGDNDPEAELRELTPVARRVSEALKGGGEGPERRSEARLLSFIARSETKRARPRRQWFLPVFGTAGWVVATVACVLYAYQFGIERGGQEARFLLARSNNQVSVFRQEKPVALPDPPVKPSPKQTPTARNSSTPPPRSTANEKPPVVHITEIVSTDDLLASLKDSKTGETESNSENPQVALLREGRALLTQGEWQKAADSFEQAANSRPDDEASLDALGMAAAITGGALNDPKRAGTMYRKQIELARRMIDRRDAEPGSPPVELKHRLARALTQVGLLERNPKLILQAAQETIETADAAETTEQP